MKILILNGSPHPKGNTKALVDAFTKGAQSAGHEVTECPVGTMNIKECLGIKEVCGDDQKAEATLADLEAFGASIK